MKFSERQGYAAVKNFIQKDTMDDDLRNSLWNALTIYIFEPLSIGINEYGAYSSSTNSQTEDGTWLIKYIWIHFLKKPIDTIPRKASDAFNLIRNYFFQCEFYEVYDFIEFLVQNLIQISLNTSSLTDTLNAILEKECSAYRFMENRFVEITTAEELNEIREILVRSSETVKMHLDRAINLFSDRKVPDYKNSVKESISAVEAAVHIIMGSDKTLGDLLGDMKTKNPHYHPAFMDAMKKLYGYTSDKGGIRHGAKTDDEPVCFHEAKYVLVICSAFINLVQGTYLQDLSK